MTYEVEIYLTSSECGTVLDASTLEQAHQVIADYASVTPDLTSADWRWNIWNDSTLVESGPVA